MVDRSDTTSQNYMGRDYVERWRMARGEGVMGSLYTCLESSCQYKLVEDIDGS